MTNDNSDDKQKCMSPPNEEDIQKPFFAYGIFKPGQIAFSKIEKYAWKCEPYEIYHTMYIRDGVPLIKNMESSDITRGYVIYFNKEDCKKAYGIISETEPLQLYEWGTISVGDEECNVLFGKDFDKGSHRSVDDNERYVDDFDGQNDPYFKDLIHFLRCEMKHDNSSDRSRCNSDDCNCCSSDCRFYSNGCEFYSLNHEFYKLQMHYMLLWSAIDRYCSLKYGAYLDQWELRSKLANDEVFRNSFQKCWDQKKIKTKRRNVYSTLLLKRKFNKNPWFAINYYYTIRCNVVHRGKAKRIEEDLLRESLIELLDIFEGVINYTFFR